MNMNNPSDFVVENGVLTKYVGLGGDVVIPAGVIEIGDHAFFWRRNLMSVTIPDSVTRIGDHAFDNCDNLTNVSIPDSLTSIGVWAFTNCKSLTGLSIPDSLINIGDSAFRGCLGLADKDGFVIIRTILYDYRGGEELVAIPEGVTGISEYAFMESRSLKRVHIPDGVTGIGAWAFSDCDDLASVTIPDSVTSIGESAFNRKTHILIRDISGLPAPLRFNAVIGFLENGGEKGTAGFDSCSKYIKANAAKLVDTAMGMPALLSMMCREKLITPKNVELYVSAAQKTGDAELIAMMLDYQGNKINVKQKEGIEKRKEKEADTVIDRMTARQGKKGIDGLNIAVTVKLETFQSRQC
jgi:hypothetical protein